MTSMRNSTKAFMILGIVIVFAVGGRMILSVLNPPNDLALIKTALADSIKATKEGRPGGVMDKLSVNLKFNGESESGNRNEIARYIRNSRPEVTVEQIEPVVTGDEARIVSPVDLKIGLLGVNKEAHLKEVTIVFKKEEDHEWLFFPSQKWKVAEVQVPNDSVADLFQP